MRRMISFTMVFLLLLAGITIIDTERNVITQNAKGAILYVGGSGGGNYSTIQEAVDAAGPGDSIHVSIGTYAEDLVINKTISLIGESKLTTIIDTTGNTNGIHIINVHYVNISGFKIKAANSASVRLTNSNHSYIANNIFEGTGIPGVGYSAMVVNPGSFNIIEKNEFIDNLNGVIISGSSRNNIVHDNEFENGDNRAISFENNAFDNTATENNISGYFIGIYVYESEGNTIKENLIYDGFEGARIFVVDDIVFSDNSISDTVYGINASSADFVVVNCSLQNIESYNIWISDPDSIDPLIVFYNTTFDEDKIRITDSGSTLYAYFTIQIKVEDEEGQPAAGISVVTTDKHGSSPTKPYITDSEGIVGPLTLFGFIETESQRNYSTPYNITASDINIIGWATPEVEFAARAVITVVVYLDSDGDDVFDKDDAFPADETQWKDSDGDGYGDNPQGNEPDAFPNDASEWADSDSDGVGDNSDAFPNDPAEQNDTDNDGVGDSSDAFPNDSTESKDSDGDGVGDNADKFPKDPDEWEDSDSDGVGDNSDFMPDFNNTIFYLIILIVIIIIVLVLLFAVRKRRKLPVQFDDEEKTE